MKKVVFQWDFPTQAVYCEVCEDDFVIITKEKLKHRAYNNGILLSPDRVIVEDFNMGNMPNKC